MHIEQIWRYPVKSMAGERLRHAQLGALGVPGDRELAVLDSEGRIVSARTRPALLLLHAARDGDGNTLVDGLDWRSEAVAERVRAAAGAEARLVELAGPGRFDILPLSVATDGAVAALGIDHRRLRPNLVIGGVDGLAERAWTRSYLQAGDAVIGLERLRPRCIMTTFDPDTGAQDRTVLERIRAGFDGTFALDAWVARPGAVAEGDTVHWQAALDDADEADEAQEPLWGRFAQPRERPPAPTLPPGARPAAR